MIKSGMIAALMAFLMTLAVVGQGALAQTPTPRDDDATPTPTRTVPQGAPQTGMAK